MKKYKGWFWFCPIYWEPEKERLSPRFNLDYVLEFVLWLHNFSIFFTTSAGVPIELYYPIKVTDTRWVD